MRASVIVPTRNRAESLVTTLRSLLVQRVAPESWDLVVVDNGSTDHTADVVNRAFRGRPDVAARYVHEPVPGLLSGRHRGIQETNADILVFVDDDIDADPGWLAAILDSFRDPTVHMVGGRNLPRFEGSPPSWLDEFWETTPHGGRACTWLSFLDLGDTPIDIDPAYVWGLNFSIRRQTAIDAGGFHPDCVPKALQRWQGDGETGLSDKVRAQGRRAVYQPKALLYHCTPSARLTPEYFASRAFYQGVCDSYTAVRAARGEMQTRRIAARGRRVDVLSLFRRLKALRLSRIRRQATDAYEAGFRFHQDAVGSDPRVLSWVLREEYWDYTLPSDETTA